MSLLKVITVTVCCGGATVLIGIANIWLGILAAPILYSLAGSLLSE